MTPQTPPGVHPKLCRSASIRGEVLRARTPRGELDIRGPARVLNALAMLCDGTRSIEQVEAAIGAQAPWPPLREFLAALLANEVLRNEAAHPCPISPASVTLAWIHDIAEDAGFKLAQASLSTPQGPVHGYGRAADANTACAMAISESAERHAYQQPGIALKRSAGRDLPGSRDPSNLVRHAPGQYRQASLAVRPYDGDREELWARGTLLSSGEPLWIPAELVYNAHALPQPERRAALVWQTSSGCASDTNVDTAKERAGLEVVERDALARHWLAQRPGVRIAPTSLPPTYKPLLDVAKAHALELDLGILQGLAGPVVITAATSPRHGLCAVSTACANTLDDSLEHALAGSLVTALARAGMPLRRIARRAKQCREPIDHGDLYAQRRHATRAHAITRGGGSTSFSSAQKHWPSSLASRLAQAAVQRDTIWVDMTRADAPLSLDGRRIRTVRVLIPGAIPLQFGYDALPRGMGADSHPRGRFPHPLA